jgi:hypothetical protein
VLLGSIRLLGLVVYSDIRAVGLLGLSGLLRLLATVASY